MLGPSLSLDLVSMMLGSPSPSLDLSLYDDGSLFGEFSGISLSMMLGLSLVSSRGFSASMFDLTRKIAYRTA